MATKKKILVYASSRNRIDNLEEWLEKRLDKEGDDNNKLHEIDVLKVTGPLTVIEKAHNLSTFMSEGSKEYNPRILVATSGATNAGIDSNQIYSVIRLDMPSKRIDIVQERGCAGRFADSNPDSCSYNLYFCLNSFEYKFRQIMSNHNIVLDDSYREEMKNELFDTLKLLTIPSQCITQELENAMSNPNLDIDTFPDPCGRCFACKMKCHGRQIRKEGMKSLLFNLFGDGEGVEGELTTSNITNVIRKRQNDCKKIFNVKRPTAVEVETIVLTLIAAELLVCKLKMEEEEKNERVLLKLAFVGTNFLINDDNAWQRIPFYYFRK